MNIESSELVNTFQACSLEELQAEQLMNRVDSKFLVPYEKIPSLLVHLKEAYRALEMGGRRRFRYENIYYDTRDYHLYQMHHQGRLNRYKIRVRNYLDANQRYLELKFKNNKKRTLKERLALPQCYDKKLHAYHDFLTQTVRAARFEVGKSVFDKTALDFRELSASQSSAYVRCALMNFGLHEKVSIDTEIKFKSLAKAYAGDYQVGDTAVVEIKQPRLNRASPAFEYMRKFGFRPASFSKYCVGLMLASEEHKFVRYNRFKPVSRLFNNTIIRKVGGYV